MWLDWPGQFKKNFRLAFWCRFLGALILLVIVWVGLIPCGSPKGSLPYLAVGGMRFTPVLENNVGVRSSGHPGSSSCRSHPSGSSCLALLFLEH